ncbi:MAG: hypothetical protein U0931_13520 [Vulcanimicrobiota bacterium]
MSDTMKLDFAQYLAEIGLTPSTPAGLAAAQELDEAQQLLKDALAQLQSSERAEEQIFAAVEVALGGIRLNDRKLRLLAQAFREALDRNCGR